MAGNVPVLSPGLLPSASHSPNQTPILCLGVCGNRDLWSLCKRHRGAKNPHKEARPAAFCGVRLCGYVEDSRRTITVKK